MENEHEEVKDPAAVLAELRRVQEDLKNVRAQLKTVETEKADLENKLAGTSEEAVEKWRQRALTAETKVSLGSQGIKDVDRLIKYVGTDGLDFDDDGKITGLDERLTQLKQDLPEIFDAKVRAGGKGDIFADNPSKTQMTSTEAQVARLFK